MQDNEPRLRDIEDYDGKESKEKKLTVWIVILSLLLVGAIYMIIVANTDMPEPLVDKETTGIIKY